MKIGAYVETHLFDKCRVMDIKVDKDTGETVYQLVNLQRKASLEVSEAYMRRLMGIPA